MPPTIIGREGGGNDGFHALFFKLWLAFSLVSWEDVKHKNLTHHQGVQNIIKGAFLRQPFVELLRSTAVLLSTAARGLNHGKVLPLFLVKQNSELN